MLLAACTDVSRTFHILCRVWHLTCMMSVCDILYQIVYMSPVPPFPKWHQTWVSKTHICVKCVSGFWANTNLITYWLIKTNLTLFYAPMCGPYVPHISRSHVWYACYHSEVVASMYAIWLVCVCVLSHMHSYNTTWLLCIKYTFFRWTRREKKNTSQSNCLHRWEIGVNEHFVFWKRFIYNIKFNQN